MVIQKGNGLIILMIMIVIACILTAISIPNFLAF